jgi:hypothetical protein
MARSGASPGSGQVAAGLAGFLGFRGFALTDLALTGFREATGLMLIGLPAVAGVTIGSGSGLKYTRQPGESWDLFLIMQAVMRSTSGTNSPQSCMASPLQACCSSGV